MDNQATMDPLAEAIKALQVVIANQGKTFELFWTRYEKDMKGMQERFQAEINEVRQDVDAHSLKCVFSPERDGMAQKMIDRVDRVEAFISEIKGGFALIKWAGISGVLALIALLVKAYTGI